MSKRKNVRKLLLWQNNYTFLKMLATNCYMWENVPTEIDLLYVEKQLCDTGYVIFFYDDVVNQFVCLSGYLEGFDKYGNPVLRTALGENVGYEVRGLNQSNSVVIYDNTCKSPIYSRYAYQYADDLTNVMISRRVNMEQQRFPYLFIGETSQQLTLKNIYNDIEEGKVAVFADKNIQTNEIKCLNVNVPYVCDKLTDLKSNIINEYLTLLGIENTNMNKRERMVADEVNGNYGVLEISRNMRLTPRQQAVKKINEMFGLNISVKFNSGLYTGLNASDVIMGKKIKEVENE